MEQKFDITEQVVNLIEKAFKPVSIFMYGSQVHGDTNNKSDFEIACIFDDKNYKSRSEIKNLLFMEFSSVANQYSIFPFRKNELLNFTFDTPFQKNIYMKSLIEGGAKTLAGERIIETLKPPILTKQDLIEDTLFNLGFAFSASQVAKSGNLAMADNLFYRSCLYCTRNLIWFKTGKLISGYNNVYKASLEIEIPKEYSNLIRTAIDTRNCEQKCKPDVTNYYKNISYINKYILTEI